MKPLNFLYKVAIALFMTISLYAGDSCVSCHGKIEDIRHSDSDMMKQIAAMGKEYGDSKGVPFVTVETLILPTKLKLTWGHQKAMLVVLQSL